MSRNTPDILMQIKHNEVLSDKEYIRKFRMFFTGLCFAILSFIGSNPVKTACIFVKVIEIVALCCLLLCGMLLMAKLSGVRISDTSSDRVLSFRDVPYKLKFLYIIFNKNFHYWTFFILGMTCLVGSRSIALLI